MSKLNKAGAAKKAAQSKQIRNGCYVSGCHSPDKGGMDSVNGGHWHSPYEIGYRDWQNGTPLSTLWHLHRQQGWKKARDRDIQFAEQCPAAQDRVLARLAA